MLSRHSHHINHEEAEMGRISTSPKILWRQLPFIILGGLLIGAVFGEAIKAFAPAQTTMVARAKSRP